MFIIPPIGRLLRRDVLLLQVVPTFVVFLVLLTFAIISWRSAETTLQAQKNQTIAEKMDALEDTIRNRIQTSEVLLRAGAGLFDASEGVSAQEWSQLYSKFEVQQKFAGVSALGYAPVVQAPDKAAFETVLRTENNNPNLSIMPPGDRPFYVPVLYFESFRADTGDALGFDMYTDSSRRQAMDRAADSGKPVMSDKVPFFQSKSSGVIQYMPVYTQNAALNTVSERRAALRGYIFASIRLNELFQQSITANNFEFAVKGPGSNHKQQVLFSTIGGSQNHSEDSAKLVRSSDIDILGQKWQVELLAKENLVSPTDNERPSTILTAGIAISLIASVAVYLLIQFRTRSFALGEERKLQQAKDELLSLASHQLRTPATGVKQYIGMVLDGFGGRLLQGQVKLLDQAYKSNERQLQIINEFLYVAKLGSGSLTTTKHMFNLVSVIQDVVDEMASDIKEKGHTLDVVAPKSLELEADEHSIRMILENLLSNAIKYTPDHGHITVTIKMHRDEVQVAVRDNGIGIAKKDTSLLFKQFSRIPNEFSVNISGSGIGLYLSQQLAERNDGRITVESELGEGSLFTLHLPNKSVKNLTKLRKKS